MNLGHRLIGITGTPYTPRAHAQLARMGYRVISVENEVKLAAENMFIKAGMADYDMDEVLYGEEFDAEIWELGMNTPRQACNKLHFIMAVRMGSDIWYNSIVQKIVDEIVAGGDVVVPDVNSPLAKDFIRNLQGRLIHQSQILNIHDLPSKYEVTMDDENVNKEDEECEHDEYLHRHFFK